MTQFLTIDSFPAEAPPGPLTFTADAWDDSGATTVRYLLCDYKIDTDLTWYSTYARRVDAPGPYRWVMDLVEGHSYVVKVTAFFTIGSKAAQTAPMLCKAPPPSFVPSLIATPGPGTKFVLDASGSIGDGLTFAWELNGAALPDTTPSVSVLMPDLGPQQAAVTVSDSHGNTGRRVVNPDVVWNGTPFSAMGGGQGAPTSPWGPPYIDPYGPYKRLDMVKDSSGFQAMEWMPDGWARLIVRHGDQPTTGGGNRAGASFDDFYKWAEAGYKVKPNFHGQLHPDDGPRFYRVQWKFPKSIAGWFDSQPLDDVHNDVEWHGGIGGGSTVKIEPVKTTTPGVYDIGVSFAEFVMGVWNNAGSKTIAKTRIEWDESYTGGVEHSDGRIVEVLWRTDRTGYVRVYDLSGNLMSMGVPSMDGTLDTEGRVYGQTRKTTMLGETEIAGFNDQLYCDPHRDLPAGTGPTHGMYKKGSRIGLTVASVLHEGPYVGVPI